MLALWNSIHNKEEGILKKLIILLIISIASIAFLILLPLKYAKNIRDIQKGYILGIQQSTGPVWTIKNIIGNNELNLAVGEQVILNGYNPYLKLSKRIVTCPRNLFYFELLYVNDSYDVELDEKFKVLEVIDWNICYPISRDNTLLNYSRRYLNVFDYFG